MIADESDYDNFEDYIYELKEENREYAVANKRLKISADRYKSRIYVLSSQLAKDRKRIAELEDEIETKKLEIRKYFFLKNGGDIADFEE